MTRTLARALLLLFAFTVPWEYSLVFDDPFGNIARVAGLALLLAAMGAVLAAGRMRKPGALQYAAAALFLWLCCTCFWSVEPMATFRRLPGYAQEMMAVWLLWELVDDEAQWRGVLQAYLAGCWALAVLTIAAFLYGSVPGQARFVAEGQDPNDTARYMVLAVPLAALLLVRPTGWSLRLLAGGYIPFCIFAVMLTASRSGFVALVVALAGCGIVVLQAHRRAVIPMVAAIPVIAGASWLSLPRVTLARIASLGDQLTGGDLNQRLNIWAAGWQAVAQAPFLGSGAGTFVTATGLAPGDTAHNTALAFSVEDGMIALLICSAILLIAGWCILRTRSHTRIALWTALVVLLLCSLIATIQENRATWLLLGVIAVAARLPAGDAEAARETATSANGNRRRLIPGAAEILP